MGPALEHFSFVAVAFCYGDYRLGRAVEAKDNVATRGSFLLEEPQRSRQQKWKLLRLHSEVTGEADVSPQLAPFV